MKILRCWWCGEKHKYGFHATCWEEFKGWMMS